MRVKLTQISPTAWPGLILDLNHIVKDILLFFKILEILHFVASASKYVIIQFWHNFKRDTVAVGGSFGAMTLTILHLILLFPNVLSNQDSLTMRVRYIFN